jgi:hypothetical protein
MGSHLHAIRLASQSLEVQHAGHDRGMVGKRERLSVD